MSPTSVQSSLRRWFFIHGIAGIVFAAPLLFWPTFALELLGWSRIDPLATRLVGAALAAIGALSLMENQAGPAVYCAFLRFKLIWSTAAIVAFVLSGIGGDVPTRAWMLLGGFVLFWSVWLHFSFGTHRLAP